MGWDHSGVQLQDAFALPALADTRINLCCRQRFVHHQLLHDPNINALLDQVSAKTMPKTMRREGRVEDPCAVLGESNEVRYRGRAQWAAPVLPSWEPPRLGGHGLGQLCDDRVQGECGLFATLPDSADGDADEVLLEEPESSVWLKLHNLILGPLVPEQLL